MDRNTETSELEEIGAAALSFPLTTAFACGAITGAATLFSQDLLLSSLIGISGGVVLGAIAASSATLRKRFVAAVQLLGAL